MALFVREVVGPVLVVVLVVHVRGVAVAEEVACDHDVVMGEGRVACVSHGGVVCDLLEAVERALGVPDEGGDEDAMVGVVEPASYGQLHLSVAMTHIGAR